MLYITYVYACMHVKNSGVLAITYACGDDKLNTVFT